MNNRSKQILIISIQWCTIILVWLKNGWFFNLVNFPINYSLFNKCSERSKMPIIVVRSWMNDHHSVVSSMYSVKFNISGAFCEFLYVCILWYAIYIVTEAVVLFKIIIRHGATIPNSINWLLRLWKLTWMEVSICNWVNK